MCLDPRTFRRTEVDVLLGDPTKAETMLGWEPQIRFPELVKTMVEADLQEPQPDQLCQTHGFDLHQPQE
jgi:GDPmannose 4,6-dehydratase